MGQRQCRTKGAEQTVGEKPDFNHVPAHLRVGLKKAVADQPQHQGGYAPLEHAGKPSFAGNNHQWCEVFIARIFCKPFQYPFQMARTDHGDDGLAGGRADLVCHVLVPLIDQGALGSGKGVGEGLHHLRKHVLVLQIFDLLLGDGRVGHQSQHEVINQPHFVPPAKASPSAAQGDLNVPVGQNQLRPHLLGLLYRTEHFRPRLDPQPVSQAALKRRQDQVRQEHGGAFLPHDLKQVHFPPRVGLGESLMPCAVQLDADAIRPHSLDQLGHLVGAAGGDVSRPDDVDGPAGQINFAHVF